MTDVADRAEQRQAEWARRITASTIPARLTRLLGSYLDEGATTVSVAGALTARRSDVALDLHHPAGRDSGPRGPMDRRTAPLDVEKLLTQLRRSCYHRHMGTWFHVQVWLEPGAELDIIVSDMAEPVVTDAPASDLEWQAEWLAHRRDDIHLPPWWQAKLFR